VSPAPPRRTATADPGGLVALALSLTLVALTGLLWVVVHTAARVDGRPTPPRGPVDLVVALASGDVLWTPATTWIAAAAAVVLGTLATLAFLGITRGRRRRTRVDHAAARMGRGRDIAPLTRTGAKATATRLGVAAGPGLPIARALPSGQVLYTSWEDVAVLIAGPRTQKTTSYAIPWVLQAPGAVLVTSNKRDVVDATRDLRAQRGQVWVFDPQGLVDEPPTWWWNPLAYVTDEVKAAMLADVFVTATRQPRARGDAYFDAAATDLLAGLLLAAARDGRPITDVYLWLTRPHDDEPALILREHGDILPAAAVEGAITLPEKQRGGVYGTAQQMASFLTNRQATAWVTPNPGRDQLVPAELVRSGATLYSLSKEGRGSAAPLVTALTVALTEAAEDLAKTSPGGRLPVPMVAVLDEAANVCRWRELPNLYSHYGSRGIVMLTVLQSWSQGVEVWGRDGMRKLWSAANVKIYGGGVAEAEFLGELRQVIGTHDVDSVSVSSSRHGRSRSTTSSGRTKDILDVADLAALPKGRSIVLASGTRPVLAATMPWMDGPHAERIRVSIAAHDPAAALRPAVPAGERP
jgi:type IV secretory pathway TraG/TraD family ATPase VirD4